VGRAIAKLNSVDVAVFSRNHRSYLEEATTRDPSAPIVFRARAKWATAEREIGRLGALPI
jgi:hypothetical protein